MDKEVQDVYTKTYFDQKVEVMRSYMNNGITDISPVIDSYTDALLDVYPQVSSPKDFQYNFHLHVQARYQPMDLYFKTRCFIATHLPEIVYEKLYIG